MADILRMIVVLSALCGLSGFALSYLKMVTTPVIEEQVLTYVQGPAIAGVFTDIDNQPIADRKAFETEKGRVLVFPAMRDGKLVGVALEAKGKGYGGDVGVMVGFNVANDTLGGHRHHHPQGNARSGHAYRGARLHRAVQGHRRAGGPQEPGGQHRRHLRRHHLLFGCGDGREPGRRGLQGPQA